MHTSPTYTYLGQGAQGVCRVGFMNAHLTHLHIFDRGGGARGRGVSLLTVTPTRGPDVTLGPRMHTSPTCTYRSGIVKQGAAATRA